MITKKIFISTIIVFSLFSCTNDRLTLVDIPQKTAELNIKGYSKPDVLQLKLNGEPIVIEGQTSYTNSFATKFQLVVDKGEQNTLGVYNYSTGAEIKSFDINYDNLEDYKVINFFNLPGIFLQTAVVKPSVNLGKLGYQFIFPNLGELSGSKLEKIKGILKRDNGSVLASFDDIGKKEFTKLQTYNVFNNNVPVYLELYKEGSTEPYFGSSAIRISIKQVYINNDKINLIVLQEKEENGSVVVKGDIDVADYL